MKGNWRMYVVICLVLCIVIGFHVRAFMLDKSNCVIRDPMIIYSDGSIERFDARSIYSKGVYGVISEAKLKKLIGMNEQGLLGEELGK